MDESPNQLIKETWVALTMKPGKDTKVDFEYERGGVCNIFVANEPLAGKRYVQVKATKTKKDWAIFIRQLADSYYIL